ncbi:hypothetical protein B0T22DRAFT_388398 [Podospora appendiculata]|uniref:Alternative oxidase n=1 Tax=Podospora appendiculata TaxID=314037 RepID=A0AAE0WYX6_9PEZI|nr:hypothetical protein B0T22DRAFT_388398 [Podospora appendiculata]
MARQRGVLFVVCLISLATLWSCRLPKMCVYSQCNTDSGPRTTPASSTNIDDGLDLSQPDAPFVSWPLARVCKETTWTPGIVFVCDNNSGGIGNIRNYILTCVRYAIEAGAAGLVLPTIRTRSEADLSSLMQSQQGFDYFFDEGHFRKSLQGACPQFTIYSSTDDIPNAMSPFQAEPLTPRNLGVRGGCDNRELNKHSDRFGLQFRAHVQQHAEEFNMLLPSPKHPRGYRLNWGVQWDFPVHRDGPEFVASFGGLLKFRADILDLGRKTAAYMRAFAAAHDQAERSRAYAGMHLRTESDALSNWPRFENQSGAYLKRASSMKLQAAYLATGNKTEAEKLARSASSTYDMGVVTKHELLKDHPVDLKALEVLTWDQQALVDFVVLLDCDYFLGVSPSSFSMNVALKRHLKADGLHTRPWKVGGDGDAWSWLVGSYQRYWDDWLFMYDSLWP